MSENESKDVNENSTPIGAEGEIKENILQENEIADEKPENVEDSAKDTESVPEEEAAPNIEDVSGDFNASDERVDPVTVQPVEFANFDFAGQVQGDANKNLDLLMDIKLQLTVELGRTELPIKKVLELTRGSIIELDKAAGETVELYANGKHVANGEVVVIEDNFGLRITGITSVEERMKDF